MAILSINQFVRQQQINLFNNQIFTINEKGQTFFDCLCDKQYNMFRDITPCSGKL